MIVVADTSPVLHLARIGRLDLIRVALGRVMVPRTVWSELIQPGTRVEVIAAIRAATWIEMVEDPQLRDLGLDPGETAALLLAESTRADAVLIDERRGRAIERVRPVVAELRADGFWSADTLVDDFLAALGELP